MALPALLGAAAKAIGGSMVKAGGRAAAGKVLGRGRKRQPGRTIPGREGVDGGKGGAIIKPKTKMVSAKEIKSLQTGDAVSPGKDPLKSIYSNVIIIEKILKGTLAAEKDQQKQQKKDDKKGDREAQEKKLETKTPNPEKKTLKMPKVPGMGIFGFIKNFIGNVILGYFAVRLIKYLPQMLGLLKGLGKVVDFVTDVGMFLVDGVATFINFAYNVYDGTRNLMKKIGGDALMGAFDGIMKAVEVAITVLTFALGAKSLGGFGGGKGGKGKPQTRIRSKPQEAFQAGRPKGMQPSGTTSQGAASRYAKRYGEGAAKRRFGQAAGKKAAQQAAGKLGVKGAAKVLGPLVKRIPVIGGLIEFVLSVVSGDSVGKAAFRAVGSGLGTWIGGALGSLIPVPFVGTAIGAFVGGAGGSELAGAMYDAFFGGKEKQPEPPEEPEAKQSGGEVGRDFQKDTISAQKKSIRKKPSYEKIKVPEGGKIKTGKKTERAYWDFLGWAGTGGKDETIQLGGGGMMLANRVANVGNSFGDHPYFGPILSLAAKIILGQTPDEREYKNVGYGLNMLVGDGINKGKINEGISGYEDGGLVKEAMAGVDISRWATDTFKKELSETLYKDFDKKNMTGQGGDGSTSGPDSAPGVRDSATGELQGGTAGGAISPSQLFAKIGANAEQWDIFRNSVALIESNGDYSIPGGSGMHYDGRYQMGAAAKKDGARYAGLDYPGHSDDPDAQVRASYRADKELQEAIFTGFTLANHTYLMGNKTYKDSSIERKLQILGYAHNQGMGGAENWITTGVVGKDGFGTKGTKYTDLIAANFRAKKSGGDLQIAEGAVSVPSLPDEPGNTDTSGSGNISASGSGVVAIGKDLISKGFSVAEHPDFTKTPTSSGGAYTPGKGSVSNVHKGAGHYDGRAIDVTDWRGSLADSKARYRSVLTSLQDNPAINMLIHDSWGGMYAPGQKQGPGAHGHPTHMHIETKRSHAGTKLSNREQMLKILPGQSLLDENTSKALGATNLARFNAASTPEEMKNIAGQIAGVSDYASYEQGAQQTVMVQDPPQQQMPESPSSSGGGMMVMGGGSNHDPFEFLDYQG